MKFQVWILIALTFLLVSCATVKQEPQTTHLTDNTTKTTTETELPSQGSQPIGPSYPVPNTKKVFTVKIEHTNYQNYTGAVEKLQEAEKLIAIVINSEEYKKAITEWTFQGSKKFHFNKNLTNEEIYLKLFSGDEALMPAINYQMDLKVTMYLSKFVSTVGYTYPSDLVVHTNWKYHQGFDSCRVASNLVHEWTHKMGFDHEAKATKDRPYTVPYAHNTIIEELCNKAKKGQLTEIR